MANKTLNTRIVLAQDTTTNLTGSQKVWLKGEVVIENCDDGSKKLKIGDGINTWDDLDYLALGGGSQVLTYKGDTTDVAAAVAALGITPEEGMMLVITDDDGNIAGYVYADGSWKAFSGNVSADNVIFSSDITCAGDYTQVGNVTKTKTATTTIAANGKSIADVMKAIFTKELQPTKTEPSVSLTFSQAGAYEVGTTVTPGYSATLNAGSYTYGPATGITADSWTISDSATHTATTSSGTFAAFTVTDTTNYTIKAEATYSQGTVAQTNMGNPSNPAIQIAAGSKDKTSSAVTGYRQLFYGVIDDLNALDSAIIRGLTGSGKKACAGKYTVSVNGDTNAKRIIIAFPTAYNLAVTKVDKTDGLVTDITSTYSLTGHVQVDGCGSTPDMVSYDIWTYQPASIDSAEVHEITIG